MKSLQITLGDRTFSWVLTHAARRTVQLKLAGPDSIVVAAPRGYSRALAEELIQEKTPWILRHAARLSAVEQAVEQFSAEHGGTVPYLGDRFTLAVAYHPVRPSVRFDGRLLRICLPENCRGDRERIRKALVGFYTKEAQRYLAEKTAYWSGIIGVKPVKLTIRDPKTRWGSCSSKRNINYSWRIMLAPMPVVDYLVVHELCHMLEPNHSARYWQLVGSFLPDFRTSRRWLKSNGSLLMRLFLPEIDP